MQETTPLSIYVHVPWCLKKCPYCDFNSHEITKEGFPEREYVEALLIDFERSFRHVNGRKISSIFFGGGTPSVFTPMSFERIITAIEKKTSFDGNIEITMEVNPEALTVDKFRDFKKAGINRLSMGVQSFVDRHLKSLGRVHNAKSAIMAIDESKSVFDNINVDIMYGLPQQTHEDAETDILILLERNVTHISAYQLTIEPNTLFSSRRPCLPNETIMDSIEFLVKRLLREEGFSQYEVSAYCRSGFESKHNINYWTFGDYIGIGAGAPKRWNFQGNL